MHARFIWDGGGIGARKFVSTIVGRTQRAGVSMAFVLDGDRVAGIVTVTDLLENILGMKV